MPLSVRLFGFLVLAAVVYVGSATLAIHGLPVLGVALIGAAAVMLPLWLLIRPTELQDERRAKGLCVRCGYDIRGNTSGVCPECGSRRLRM
jgi:uncharacterized paraquat-inducible protein A